MLWEKELGLQQTRNAFGEGSSPALHGDTLVVPWDHEGADFVVALDAATGKERWRRERDEPTNWTTPHVVEHGGRAQVVVGGTNKLISLRPADGRARVARGGPDRRTSSPRPSPRTASSTR